MGIFYFLLTSPSLTTAILIPGCPQHSKTPSTNSSMSFRFCLVTLCEADPTLASPGDTKTSSTSTLTRCPSITLHIISWVTSCMLNNPLNKIIIKNNVIQCNESFIFYHENSANHCTLDYIVLNYITWHRTFDFIIWQYIESYYIALPCIALHCIALHYSIKLHCIALHYIALHWTKMHHIIVLHRTMHTNSKRINKSRIRQTWYSLQCTYV